MLNISAFRGLVHLHNRYNHYLATVYYCTLQWAWSLANSKSHPLPACPTVASGQSIFTPAQRRPASQHASREPDLTILSRSSRKALSNFLPRFTRAYGTIMWLHLRRPVSTFSSVHCETARPGGLVASFIYKKSLSRTCDEEGCESNGHINIS